MNTPSRQQVADWFHREFTPSCVHPANSEPQCEAWADALMPLFDVARNEALEEAADVLEVATSLDEYSAPRTAIDVRLATTKIRELKSDGGDQ